MLRDVNINLSDGALASAVSAVGIHAKIGASPVTAGEAIVIRSSMSARRIRELLGFSPLADAVMDSVENGANLIYCIPVAASTAGTPSSVTADAQGSGTVAVSGSPNNAYRIKIKVTAAGGLNEAAVRVSLDGGSTWNEEQTVPSNGSLAIENTGLTLTFTAGEDGFAPGDLFSFTTTAPAMTNDDVLQALDMVRGIHDVIEFVHIVGNSEPSLWSACAAVAATYHSTYKKPLFLVMEAEPPASRQNTDDYVTSLVSQRRGVESIYLQVVTARGNYRRMDGTTQEINLAGLICGLYARASVQQSIGETRSFAISDEKLLSLTPEGIEAETETLDAAGYLTLRRYEGLSGWYVTNARLLCPDGSDYQYAERIRVTNKICREVRARLLTQLQRYVDLSNLDRELSAIGEMAMIPLDDMIAAGEISSARVIVPEGQDILTSETLELVIRYVPVGHVREIRVDLGMENPYAAN